MHVATDDERIARAVEAAGFAAVMTSADHASGTDRLAEAAKKLKLKDNEVVVNVQGDEPLISPRLIRDVGTLLKSGAMQRGHRVPRDPRSGPLGNPNVVKVVLDAAGYALYFSRSQIPYPREPGAACYRHAGIYGYRVGFLKKYARLKPSPLEKSEALEQLRVLWHGYPHCGSGEQGRDSAGRGYPAGPRGGA